jgi:hypothetical protein
VLSSPLHALPQLEGLFAVTVEGESLEREREIEDFLLKPFGSVFSLVPVFFLSSSVICFVLAKRTLRDSNTRSQARDSRMLS